MVMGLSKQPRMAGLLSSLSLLVIISLCSQLVAGEYGCPHQCLCFVDNSGFRTANCTGVEFMTAHAFQYSKIFSGIEVLNVKPHSQKPIKLKDDMFLPFFSLKYLNLSNCRIKTITKNVFNGLKKIWEIDLSDNEIQHFHSSVFENLNDLNRLSLRGNPLQMTHKPYIISHSLKELDMGKCGISSLPNEFFHGLKKLTHLLLDGNFIRNIKDHVLPRGLVDLNLAYNRIVNIPIDTLLSLTQLRRLDLHENYINCTCVFLHLQDMLSGNGVLIDGNVVCAYPIELRNTSLNKVNENEACRREVYKDKQHRKSSNAKYIHQKESYDFDNDKYSSYENFQRDQPDYYQDQVDDSTNEKDSFQQDPQPLRSGEHYSKETHSGHGKKKHKHNDHISSDEYDKIMNDEGMLSDEYTSSSSPQDDGVENEDDSYTDETSNIDRPSPLDDLGSTFEKSVPESSKSEDSFEGSGVGDINEEQRIASLGEGIQFGLDDGNEDDATEFMIIKETKAPKVNHEKEAKGDKGGDHSGNEGDMGGDHTGDEEQRAEESGRKVPSGMGQYILIGLIGFILIILILVAVIKKCRSRRNTEREKLSNMENANGTELQDITTLLPKPEEKDERNGKYPNETSPETVKLINGDKPHDLSEPTDMNQNDNRNDIVKNGVKPATEAVAPIEVTKAKLTILPDSIPKTPIFVQKNNGAIKKGVS
ncbi:protein windpipe [Nilaparvata lugens]|uniref:protein windpipe n=1 Tax=Nilaparvata lugens TaxID=108931 RepID=UPI00193CFA7B|nr:protein windpipe [Nilaparvata lugens]